MTAAVAPDVFTKQKLKPEEWKRRKKALLGSKVGITLAMLHGELAKKRELVRRGKIPLGLSARELELFLTELLVVLMNVRDFYVDEKCPRVEAKE